MSVVARGLVSTIDGTNNKHTDAIRHFSSSSGAKVTFSKFLLKKGRIHPSRTGWMVPQNPKDRYVLLPLIDGFAMVFL